MRRAAAWLAALPALSLGASPAAAGWYVTPDVRWESFAARPEGGEATRNFYGYGLGLGLGYSARQALDAGLYVSDVPGSRREAKIGKGDATLVSYGGEIGLRFAESVFVGFKGGLSRYQLKNAKDESELDGTWAGPAGGLALGAVTKLSKTSFLQTTIEVMQHVLADKGGEDRGSRRFDSFALSVAYMYNGRGEDGGGGGAGGDLFKSFLDSIMFF